jgi:hypothetical protein
MKKIIALAGSLLIFAGLKAQTNPPVKKETTLPAANNNSGVNPAVNQKNATIKQAGTIKQTGKEIKLEHKDLKDMKDFKEMKDLKDFKNLKEVKEMKEVKAAPAVKNNNIIIKK